MITVNSKLKGLNLFFNKLQKEIGGKLSVTAGENILTLNNKIGNGTIRSIRLEDGISLLEFSINAKKDIQISIDSNAGSHINFVYCSKGKISHSFEKKEAINTIETFQTSIISNVVSEKNTITLFEGVETNTTIISVNTALKKRTSSINTTLKEAFITNKTEDYIYLGSYNLKIAENIKQLRAIDNEGVVKALLTKGIVNLILALEIEQHKKDLKNPEMASSSLTKSEMELIKELTDYINNYPDMDHRVNVLTRKIGLTAAKVQEGFKLMHGLTVCEYVRTVRLKRSEELIVNTDLSISEIVYSLGFSSRSYFSKKFREMFNCSPSNYKKKNRLAVSA
ncbi:helix-turn-helix transcriptional regulator [Polaribacter batillariae]|uniref:Helix-turn-helix transcriptional regulator n=1 Tax=Polaribacter batillariae TaxID=2808900 RepID=A0ABX7SUE9_9FLAO|nr:AraC family transcriptional regulator [Polaribacter batillariae]QTD36479.1 helix-turn-helix transcriptional regulator [Polaribacter batillariae]